jgi:lipopolysaccharide export system permease protein
MLLIDRYILGRFLANFIVLFMLLFVFATAIDLTLNLDNFVEKAQEKAGPEAGAVGATWVLLRLIIDFQAPRAFQFYAYLHGLVAIGAMGFTLAQMHRFRELVAVLASGVSLQRVAMPFLAGTFAISLVQLVNQEFFLPRVAPLLLRGHGQIGESGLAAFEVPFTGDGAGNLMQAARFDPRTNTLTAPTFIERDARRTTSRRIAADSATWDEARRVWRLDRGTVVSVGDPAAAERSVIERSPLDVYPSEISPETLTVRRYAQFAGMLSLAQISQMLQAREATDARILTRYRFSRFSSVLVNVLVLVITLPSFLLREPANLLRQSVICAAMAIPCLFGAVLGMMADLPGIPAAAGVFLPVFVLIPVALARLTFIRT